MQVLSSALQMIFVYIVCKNKAEAKRIGLSLVKKRLVACCNVFPIDSIYMWKKKTIKDKEAVLIAKTIKKNFKEIEKEVKKVHSYKIPCILEIPIRKANPEYLSWLRKEIKK